MITLDLQFMDYRLMVLKNNQFSTITFPESDNINQNLIFKGGRYAIESHFSLTFPIYSVHDDRRL